MPLLREEDSPNVSHTFGKIQMIVNLQHIAWFIQVDTTQSNTEEVGITTCIFMKLRLHVLIIVVGDKKYRQ